MKRFIPKRLKTSIKYAEHEVCHGLDRLTGGYRERLWLLGDARSGTTWISSLINASGLYREIFEPVHPFTIKEFSFLEHIAYRRPGVDDPRLKDALQRLFSGRLASPFLNTHGRPAPLRRALLVKDIHANLLARWAWLSLQDVKPVLLLRHPLDVALSKMKLKGWVWLDSPLLLLEQSHLVEDHLADHLDFIRRIDSLDDQLLRYVVIWAILQKVPLSQFAGTEAHVLFYEDCVVEPEREMRRLHDWLGHDERWRALPASVTETASGVSDPAQVATLRKEPFGRWRKSVTADQLAITSDILEQFGLAQLYDEDGRPSREGLSRFAIGREAAASTPARDRAMQA